MDESIYRWYGIGGQYINDGLPQYIEIDLKPENGCEIHNAADGVSGIIMQLDIFKTSSEEGLHYPGEYYGLLSGTKVIIIHFFGSRM